MAENDAKAKGGVEAAVRAMAEHGSSAKVQEAGCKALSCVAVLDAAAADRDTVRDSGAIPLVQKAMAAFPDQEDIQRHGKAALQNVQAAGADVQGYLAHHNPPPPRNLQ